MQRSKRVKEGVPSYKEKVDNDILTLFEYKEVVKKAVTSFMNDFLFREEAQFSYENDVEWIDGVIGGSFEYDDYEIKFTDIIIHLKNKAHSACYKQWYWLYVDGVQKGEVDYQTWCDNYKQMRKNETLKVGVEGKQGQRKKKTMLTSGRFDFSDTAYYRKLKTDVLHLQKSRHYFDFIEAEKKKNPNLFKHVKVSYFPYLYAERHNLSLITVYKYRNILRFHKDHYLAREIELAEYEQEKAFNTRINIFL